MPIELPKRTRDELIQSIRAYFTKELGQEIGHLKAEMVLDYVLVEIAPAVYNQAVRDAGAYFHERALDLPGSVHEPEMTFWSKKIPGRTTRRKG